MVTERLEADLAAWERSGSERRRMVVGQVKRTRWVGDIWGLYLAGVVHGL